MNTVLFLAISVVVLVNRLTWSNQGEEYPQKEKDGVSGKCICGQSRKDTRIVGGKEATAHAYPWVGMLRMTKWPYCSCSIISDRHVLTAGHCVHGINIEGLDIVLGLHDKYNINDGSILRKPKKIIQHEKFEAASFNNDIALIELDRPVEFNSRASSVCLVSKGGTWNSKKAVVAGWGSTSEHGVTSAVLREVEVPLINISYCRSYKISYKASEISDNMLCAGYDAGGKDACQGDSGGPMFSETSPGSGQYQQIGIVSWGIGCAKPGQPGVYTRVENYMDWISKNIEGSNTCVRSND